MLSPGVKGRCPGLSFEGAKAVCHIMTEMPHLMEPMGAGKGCCFKGQILMDGKMHDFSSLPKMLKRSAAAIVCRNSDKIAYTK
jgi:hypothetical protein